MPFISEAQRRWMHANHPEMAKEWEAATPKDSVLPAYKKGSPAQKRKARSVAAKSAAASRRRPSP